MRTRQKQVDLTGDAERERAVLAAKHFLPSASTSLFPETKILRDHALTWGAIAFALRRLRDCTCHAVVTSTELTAKTSLCHDLYRIQKAIQSVDTRIEDLFAVDIGSEANAFSPQTCEGRSKGTTQKHLVVSAVEISNLVKDFERSTPEGARISLDVMWEVHSELMGLSRFQNNVAWASRSLSSKIELPTKPGRERHLELAPVIRGAVDPDDIPHRLHRQLYNTEVSAAEICAALLVRFPNAPAPLQMALARQAWDEARHAETILAKLEDTPSALRRYPVSYLLWENFRAAENLAEALCIEQVIGEGFGLGNDLFLAAKYRRLRRPDLASMQEWIHADEVNHAREGLKWFRGVSNGKSSMILRQLEKRFVHRPIADPWFFPELRLQVGFTGPEIKRQRQMAETKRP